MTVYTVCVRNTMEDEFEPWVSSFSTREKAEKFAEQIKAMLKRYGEEDFWRVSFDSGEVDTEGYLDWLRDYYENQEEEDYLRHDKEEWEDQEDAET